MTVDRATCNKGYVTSGMATESVFNAFDDKGNHSENASCNYTSTFNGTSASAPMVSGVVALMLEANPELTWRDVKHILASSARQVDAARAAVTINDLIVEPAWTTNAAGYRFHNWYGFGAVDAAAAVDKAKTYTLGSLGTYLVTPEKNSGTIDLAINELVPTTSAINIVNSGVTESVRIKLYVKHDRPSSLSVALVSPSGTRSVLLTPYNGYQSWKTTNYVELSSNAFYAENIQGDWKLEITDHVSGVTGTLNQWRLTVYGH